MVRVKVDEELTRLVLTASLLFEPLSSKTKFIVNDLRKAYELGFKRGFKTAKIEDIPWCLTDKEEAEYCKRNIRYQ